MNKLIQDNKNFENKVFKKVLYNRYFHILLKNKILFKKFLKILKNKHVLTQIIKVYNIKYVMKYIYISLL